MSKKKVITDEAIKILSASRFVKQVRSNRITFTYEFRVMMWERWDKCRRISTIRDVMKENGIDRSLFGYDVVAMIHRNFKKYGKPSNGQNNSSTYGKADHSYDEFLISTGKFIRSRRGIAFSDRYAEKLFSLYPDQPIEDTLEADGFDPDKIGYHRIYVLKKRFDGDTELHEKQTFSQDVIDRYADHPMVDKMTAGRIKLKDEFYSEASLISDMHINDILSIFMIDPAILTFSTRRRIKKQIIGSAHTCPFRLNEDSSGLLRTIALNLYEALCSRFYGFLKALGERMWDFSAGTRREACLLLASLADSHIMPKSMIISRTGMARTTFYSILRNAGYGENERQREKNDEEDAKAIIETMNYKGYPKGKRTIYMMMPGVTGRAFSVRKISRLMKKFGLDCGVRKSRQSLKAAHEMLEKYRCPNLLRRRFRLARPLTHVLTDVSYLSYGSGDRAYLSAAKDAVTGRILAAVVSESNDMKMADETLEQLECFTFSDGAIFHSDQGALYLTESFQKRVRKMGFRESMSRRGVCEDNSSQESFFGHFKDECDCSGCATIEELREMVMNYMQYYNNERPQWTRNRMTPVEYEAYLNAMTPDQFDSYIGEETARYEKMKALSAERAKARAKLITS